VSTLFWGIIIGAVIFLLIAVSVYMEWKSWRTVKKHRLCRFCDDDFGACADNTIRMHEAYCPKNPDNYNEWRKRDEENLA